MIKNKDIRICPKCQAKYQDMHTTTCLRCGIPTVKEKLIVQKGKKIENTLGK